MGIENRQIAGLLDQLEHRLASSDRYLLKKMVDLAGGDESKLLNLLKDLTQMHYDRVPVDVETFLLHRDYLGMGGERGNLYPGLTDLLVEVFEGGYKEVYLDGGIGWGKSTAAECAAAIMLYQLSVLKKPQLFYNLDPSDTLAVVNVSVNKTQAKRVVFQRLKERIKTSPYFKEAFPYDPKILSELKFDKNIAAMPTAASEGGTIGYTIYGAVMDEVNFMDVIEASAQARGQRFDQAEHVHQLLMRRITSRFPTQGGPVVAVSSSKYPDSFTEEKRKDLKERQAKFEEGNGPKPKVFIQRNSQWGPKPKHMFPDEVFYLFLGNAQQRPFVTTKLDENPVVDDGPTVSELLETVPDRIIEVPFTEEYWNAFQSNLHGSIRDIAGHPTLSIKPFFSEMDKLMDAIQRGRDEKKSHPFTSVETTLQDGAFFDISKVEFDSSKAYYAHADLALNGDAAGLAIGHVEGWKSVTKTVEQEDDEGVVTKNLVTVKAPHIVIDLMLRINAPKHGEIRSSDVRGLLMELREYGCNLHKVTADQFQSAAMLQELDRVGIEAELLSVDRNMDGYNALKEAALEDRLTLYPYMPFVEEASRLEKQESANRGKGKVDHPPKGSKDVTDAVAGVCLHCALEHSPAVIDPSRGEYTDSRRMKQPDEWVDPAGSHGHEKGTNRSMDDLMFPSDDEDHEGYVDDYVGFA